MSKLFTNSYIFTQKGIVKSDFILNNHKLITNINDFHGNIDEIINLEGLFVFPGFADVHVHFREPGFSYKETIKTGSHAAAHGGFTAVCTMPNLNPVPSNLESLKQELEIISQDSIIHVYPIGAITKNQSGRGELSNIEEIAPFVCAFSDDGKGIQSGELMREAMKRIKLTGKIITAHCEIESELVPGGCIHDGEFARINNFVGINNASEYLEVKRDIDLAHETGINFHVCHVSTKESINFIREAKKNGINVTAETAPHYLIFNDMNLEDDGKWKMNPPIRSKEDQQALLLAVQDGTIDCIITDHAPHSEQEKSRGLSKSAFGIVGLETSFSVMYTNIVKKGIITLEKLLELMCVNPRKIFNLPGPKYIENNCEADFVVVDLNKEYVIDPQKFFSMGKSTPFEGMKVYGEIINTYVAGKKVYDVSEGIICAN